jgi:photosystem II stability/assembly factor-like uncharacterized protein
MTVSTRSWRAAALAVLTLLSLGDTRFARLDAQQQAIDPALLNAYRWRSIGPDRGGRSIAVAGVKGRPREAYFGAVGGGLWKTSDAGNNWAPVTDGLITSSSVGAVAVSESSPDIVWIGMGESCIRGNIMPGDGVYKSTDAGKTWANAGFKNVDAISKIRIHPTNPDIVYVAAFGLYYGPSDERGVFKTTDGGKTWKRTLFKDNKTGAVDIAIDTKNPNVLYAAMWEAYRIEYQMSSGGPGSGLYKSTDGGETWNEITRNPGMPSGLVGRIGVALTAADSNRVYALVENENGGLFVSDDAGASWKLMNPSRAIRQRAFYYTHVFGDPSNKDVVYMQNTGLFRSTDGGKTTVPIGQNTHGDHHDLWVDPDDPLHVIDGNDGGGAITYDVVSRVPNWSAQDFPTAQWYHVITTAHLPFHVCGAQQDNSTLCVPSNTNAGGGGGGGGGNPPVAPYPVGGGEPGYIAPHATDPDIFWAGANNGSFLTRLNRRTGELKEVGAYPRFFSGEPSKDVKERWQWTYPIILAYADPNVLYTSSQRIWKTTNGGDTWEAISPDLTRHDPKTMQDSGGPITHDMNSPEIYATVFSIGPGKKDVNIIWSGSDDGIVQLTRDGGKNWTNVTPSEMPDLGRVSQIDGSSFDNGTAYVAVKKMLLGDRAPYIFKTNDYGKTWKKIVNGIAANDYVHTVREDPARRGLLFAGTQHSVYVSYNDGENWLPLKTGLPDTPTTDLVVEDNALVIGTHGRGFYVLDDIAALRQFGTTAMTDVMVFKPANSTRGLDRPIVTYYLKSQPKQLTIDFLDAKGQVVRSVNGNPPRKPGENAPGGDDDFPRGPQGAPMAAGMNRFTWDLNSTGVVTFPGMILWGATQNGPAVLPGSYQVRLTADGVTQTQSFQVLKHPLRPISDADLQFQFTLASRIRDKVNEANLAVIRIRRIKTDIADRIKDAPAEVRAAGEQLTRALATVEEDVYQVKNQSGQDPLNFPIKTNNRLASLLRVAVSGEGRPTGNVEPIFNDLVAELKAETDRLEKAISDQLPPFNNMLQRIKKTPVDGK